MLMMCVCGTHEHKIPSRAYGWLPSVHVIRLVRIWVFLVMADTVSFQWLRTFLLFIILTISLIESIKSPLQFMESSNIWNTHTQTSLRVELKRRGRQPICIWSCIFTGLLYILFAYSFIHWHGYHSLFKRIVYEMMGNMKSRRCARYAYISFIVLVSYSPFNFKWCLQFHLIRSINSSRQSLYGHGEREAKPKS